VNQRRRYTPRISLQSYPNLNLLIRSTVTANDVQLDGPLLNSVLRDVRASISDILEQSLVIAVLNPDLNGRKLFVGTSRLVFCIATL
jgi:hypothetical protein